MPNIIINIPLFHLDYVHTVSFSLAFYIVLRPQGIRKQMKTLRKRHRVHIALVLEIFTLMWRENKITYDVRLFLRISGRERAGSECSKFNGIRRENFACHWSSLY